MKCITCNHESSAYDFVTLRNLCEHLYLDAIVRKADPAALGVRNSRITELKDDLNKNVKPSDFPLPASSY